MGNLIQYIRGKIGLGIGLQNVARVRGPIPRVDIVTNSTYIRNTFSSLTPPMVKSPKLTNTVPITGAHGSSVPGDFVLGGLLTPVK